jgi:WD40 repeat protein
MECVSVMTGHSQDVKHIQWAGESEVLLSASYDNTIKVWTRDPDEEDWVLVTTIAAHLDTVWSLAINRDRLASVS